MEANSKVGLGPNVDLDPVEAAFTEAISETSAIELEKDDLVKSWGELGINSLDVLGIVIRLEESLGVDLQRLLIESAKNVGAAMDQVRSILHKTTKTSQSMSSETHLGAGI
jgi:acyl carrier protein